MFEIQSRRVALYARHSTEMQAGSATDQLDRCRRFVRDKGGTVAGEYADEAMSGAIMANRPALRRLMLAAVDGLFDAVVIEDLSRITRDLEDAAGIFKRLAFLDIALVSVSEGVINKLHVGLKGLMNELFLRDLADKVKRGQAAAVRRGKVIAAKTYGYEIVREIGPDREIIRGQRRIIPAQAEVVIRIFEAYAAGESLRGIARRLNRDGIPSPTGIHWKSPVLLGQRAAASGLLLNRIYKGEIVYGRRRYSRDPHTGSRRVRAAPRDEWITVQAPHLQIVPDDLWNRVQHRVDAASRARPHRVIRSGRPPRRYITSGITSCARCGGPVTTAFAGWVNCRAYRRHRTCDHTHMIKRDDIIRMTLRITRLAARAGRGAITAALVEHHPVRAATAAAAHQRIDRIEGEMADVTRKTNVCIDLLAAGHGGPITRRRLSALEARAASLSAATEAARRDTSVAAAEDLDRMATRAASIIAAASARLLDRDPSDGKASDIIRRTITRLDVAYRGPGRTRLRVVPHLDPDGLYELALAATRPRAASHRPSRWQRPGHHRPASPPPPSKP